MDGIKVIVFAVASYLLGVLLGAILFSGLRGFECIQADVHQRKERCITYERTEK